MQLDESPGLLACEDPHACPSLSFTLLPNGLCLLPPGCVLHSYFLLTMKSQPHKATFPCVCPEALWLLLGIMLALVFSGSRCPGHVGGVTIVLTVLTPPFPPSPQDMSRAVTEDNTYQH